MILSLPGYFLRFLLVAIIPVVMLSTGTIFVVKNVALTNTNKRVTEQFSLIDAFLEDMVVSTAMELSVIKGHNSFEEYLSTGEKLDIVKADFEGAMVRHPEFLQLRYLDRNGQEKTQAEQTQKTDSSGLSTMPFRINLSITIFSRL